MISNNCDILLTFGALCLSMLLIIIMMMITTIVIITFIFCLYYCINRTLDGLCIKFDFNGNCNRFVVIAKGA